MNVGDWIAAVSAGTAVVALVLASNESRRRAEGKILIADLERRVVLLESQSTEHRTQIQEFRGELKSQAEKLSNVHTSLEVISERLANNTTSILERIGGLQDLLRAGR